MKRGQIRSHAEHLLRADQVAKATEQVESANACSCLSCTEQIGACARERLTPRQRRATQLSTPTPLRVTIADLLRSKQ